MLVKSYKITNRIIIITNIINKIYLEMTLLTQCIQTKQSTDRPLWFMRQAGRYLPEYKLIRSKYNKFLDFCYSIEDAAIVTTQPLDRFPNIDAAILFSDILVIPDMLGINVEFLEKEGPIINFNYKDINKNLNKNKLNSIKNTINIIKKNLLNNYNNKNLIGFVGAPFTLAYYTFSKKNWKNNFYLEEIIKIYTDKIIEFLLFQIEAGVDVIKIFDSWAGLLTPDELLKYSINPITEIVKEIRKKTNKPIIIFPRNIGNNIKLYNHLSHYKNIVLALSEEQDLQWCYENLDCILQGNLTNEIFFKSKDEIDFLVSRMMKITKNKPHIYNLGHGILPHTDPNMVEYIINNIKNYD